MALLVHLPVAELLLNPFLPPPESKPEDWMSKPVRTWVSEQARRGPKVTDPFLQERIAELVVQGSQSLQYLPEEESVLKDCEEGKARYFLYINGELGDNNCIRCWQRRRSMCIHLYSMKLPCGRCHLRL